MSELTGPPGAPEASGRHRMSMPGVLEGLPRRLADWAVNRSLAPNSVTGISLALGLCAAAWFSAGTRPDNISGALALLASYLAWRAARWLAGPAAGPVAGSAAAALARPAGAGAGTLAEMSGTVSDYAVYVGLAVGGYEAHWSGTWELAAAVVIAVAVRRTAVACGGQIAGPPSDGNPLAKALRGFLAFSPGGRVAVIVVVAPIWGAHATLLILLQWGIIAIAYVITGHGPDRVTAASPFRVRSPVRPELSSRTELPARAELPAREELPARADSPASVDTSVRDVSVTAESPVSVDLPVPMDASVPAEGPVSVDPPVRVDSSAADSPVVADPPARPDSSVPAGRPGRVDSLIGLDSRVHVDSPVREFSSVPADPAVRTGSSGLSTSAALARLASGAGQSETPLALAGPSEPTMTLDLMISREPGRRREPKPRTVLDPQARATIAAYRDDGAAAVWLSRVVRGQFVPLPPAVAGLVAASFLAWLGMRNLPGMLLLTPLVVMLLAAFGSGHPHDGRLDWLVPAVLVAGQLVYIAAIGFSFGVPAPVTFTLCALIALRYVDLARRDPRNAAQAADTRPGWEGRMLVVGIGAMLGIATVAYVALAAYAGALICGRLKAGLAPPGTGHAGEQHGPRAGSIVE